MTGSGIIGTPAYMSPEQAQGEKVDNRSDIYGLGVIIFQMLSGQQPYEATTPMGVAVKHITDPVPEILKDNPDLGEQTDTIIKTAMAKDPSLRYQTATELAQALTEAAFGKKAGNGAGTKVAPAAGKAAPAAARRHADRGLLIGGIAACLYPARARRVGARPRHARSGASSRPPLRSRHGHGRGPDRCRRTHRGSDHRSGRRTRVRPGSHS